MALDLQVKQLLQHLCPMDLDPPIFDYLKQLCLYNATLEDDNLESVLYGCFSPFFHDMNIDESIIKDFTVQLCQLYGAHNSSSSHKDLSHNRMLIPLENPVVMSELNWIYHLRESTGLASFNSDEQVSGASSIYADAKAQQQKLNLELATSSNKQTDVQSSMSFVDRQKLIKAEMKQRAKQDKRDQKASNTLITSNTLPKQQVASEGALAVDEATLLQPMERSRRSRDIKLERFDIAIGGKHIVTEGNLTLPFGRRVGLVGRNGVGKSTLLRALSSRQLTISKYISILHVEQEVIGDDTPALQSVLQADSIREALLIREKRCLAIINKDDLGPTGSGGADKDVATAELSKIYLRLEEIESDKAESRAATILLGLGFLREQHNLPTRQFSGGWRMRLALARALFCRPDLLLLDEPTNMLDIPAVAWLSNYMNSWPNTVLVVSHDREFLDAICTDILHLHHETLDAYKGNYTQFLVTREDRQKHYEKEYETNIAYRQHLQEFVDRWRYNAARAALAQSKLKILEKLPVLLPWPVDPPITLQFQSVEKLSPPILQLDGVSFSYPGALATEGKTLLKDLDFSLQLDSRVAIVGPNGAGKTTFLKLLTGELEPSRGKVFIHGRLRFGYFSQHHVDQLDMNMNSIQFLANKYPGKSEEEYRRHCGSFGLSGQLALQPIFTLSGGQKSRLVFASMSLSYPHILILDEPTNHLDVDSIDALIKSLSMFEGGVVVVSHDARFIERVCTEILVCDQGVVKQYRGSIRDYVRSLPIEYPSI